MNSVVKITIPTIAREKIAGIVSSHGIFEDEHDFLVHAVMDLLEEYRS